MSALPFSMSLNSIFWNLLGLGVDRRAGEGEVEGRLARRLLPSRTSCRYSCGDTGAAAGVDDLVLHADGVVAALEGVGLDQLDAAHVGRLEAHAQLVAAVLERALAGTSVITVLWLGNVARRRSGRSAPGTRARRSRRAARKLRGLVVLVGLLEQFGAHQRAALAVEGRLSTSVVTVTFSPPAAGAAAPAAAGAAARRPAPAAARGRGGGHGAAGTLAGPPRPARWPPAARRGAGNNDGLRRCAPATRPTAAPATRQRPPTAGCGEYRS